MKQLLFITAICITLFTGCSKDDDEPTKTITNLSGVTWYNTTVVFFDTEGGDITDYEDVGTIEIGKTCSVSTEKNIFHILAKDASGKSIMSNDIHLVNNKATVTANDLK